MQVPEHYLCNEFHLWCRKDDETYLVGITSHAQSSLGEILYVEIPEPSAAIAKSQSFGIVESTKVVSELMSPLSGTVVESNSLVQDDPGLLNRDPYGAGWLLRLRVDNETDLADLLNTQQYAAFLGNG